MHPFALAAIVVAVAAIGVGAYLVKKSQAASSAAAPASPAPVPAAAATGAAPAGASPSTATLAMSYANVAALLAFLKSVTFAYAVTLDAKSIWPGFGPAVNFTTQADGSVKR